MTRPPLTRGERRLLDWLERFDFTGKGCYPTRAELAERCGYREEYISALVKGLREKDYITVTKRRRPGCQYAHNVYRIHDWSPNVRRGICNLRRDFVARRAAAEADQISSSYVERTATAGKGSCLSGTPSLRASKALPARSQARASRDLGLRRTSMDQRRHLRLEVDCPECARKDQIIRRYAETETKRAEELSGAYDTIRVQGKAITNLERAKTRQARESARAEQVERVIEHWKKHRPKTKASSFPPGGKNWQTIERALTLMAEDEDGPVTACCEAIDGLHIAPWEAYGKRYMRAGEGRTLRNRLEHALGDETRIERCRGIAKRVRGDEADRVFVLWQTARETEGAFFSVLLEKLGRRGMDDADRRFDVDGIPTDPAGSVRNGRGHT